MTDKLTVYSILLADDDEDDCMLFDEAVSEINSAASLTCVQNGIELLKKLADDVMQNSIPDLLFLDLNMPLKNGIECLLEIRANKDYDHLRVIIFSTSAQEQAVQEAYNLGANLYLKKPASFQSLKVALSQIFSLFEHSKLKKTEYSSFLIDLDDKA